MTNIQAKLEILFDFEHKLNQLLDEEQYEAFLQQQNLFDDQLKNFLSSHSEDELINIIDRLKRLKIMVQSLQKRAGIDSKQLKEKSLALQRNKKKIKSYR